MTRPANRPKAAPGLFPAGSCGCIRTRASSEARRRGGASAAAGQAALPWGSPSKEPQEAAQGVAGAAHGAQTVCGTSSSARVIEARLMRLARCVGGDCTPQARADGRRPDCAPGARPRRRRILQLLDQVDPARAGQRRRRSRASSWSSWTSTRLRTRCGRPGQRRRDLDKRAEHKQEHKHKQDRPTGHLPALPLGLRADSLREPARPVTRVNP
jgi:hypothetical protein